MLTHKGDQAVVFSVTSNREIKKKRRLKVNAGFTLTEIMIVVAIISILAAIAIPNFMNYQAKARQSEAKVGLGGIFTAATAYYASNATYTVASFPSWITLQSELLSIHSTTEASQLIVALVRALVRERRGPLLLPPSARPASRLGPAATSTPIPPAMSGRLTISET